VSEEKGKKRQLNSRSEEKKTKKRIFGPLTGVQIFTGEKEDFADGGNSGATFSTQSRRDRRKATQPTPPRPGGRSLGGEWLASWLARQFGEVGDTSLPSCGRLKKPFITEDYLN
jgi:hypothetical protein